MAHTGNRQGNRSIQTLLAAKKNNNKDTLEKSAKEPKRTHSDVELDSSIELGVFQADLTDIKNSLKDIVKKPDLDKALCQLVKTQDLETLVTSIVTKLVNTMKEELNEKWEKTYREKTGRQQKAIEDLSQENESLRELIATQRKSIVELQSSTKDNEIRSKEAVKMGNYNEQYSRKFNIKVTNYPQKEGENIKDDFIKNIAKGMLEVDIKPSEIQAIHRIWSRKKEHPHVLVKLINSEVKSRIMRVKKNLPKEGLRLVDDVTKHNMGLMTRLRDSKKFENVWYFNCAVYAKIEGGIKHKFELFDDVEKKLAKIDEHS